MTVTPGTERSRLDPEPILRRDMLGLASFWSTASALVVAVLGMLRLPKAAVLPSPSGKFRVSLPDSLGPGEAFVPPGRSVAVFRDAEGVYAISTVCTHLGCIVSPNASGFECPCHGSLFAPDGSVVKGPAPRALPWLQVSARGGTLTVDEGTEAQPGSKVMA